MKKYSDMRINIIAEALCIFTCVNILGVYLSATP